MENIRYKKPRNKEIEGEKQTKAGKAEKSENIKKNASQLKR